MLPGIRFLLAAILLSISVVVFGLGAAALLRAAHEDFASNPSWRAAPETRFAQNETPTLALLSVETPPAAAGPADVPDSVAPQTSATGPALPSEQLAAVSPAPATEAMKTEAPPPVPAPSSDPSPGSAASDASPPPDQPNKPDATPETKMAATETSVTPSKTSEAAPATSDPVKPDVASSEPPQPEVANSEASSTDATTPGQANAAIVPETATPTSIAKLDTPAVTIEDSSKTETEARKAARAAEKEKAREEKAEKKAKARRRLAAQRARAAQQLAAQRAIDPFGQLQQVAPSRTLRVQSRPVTPAQ
jgi:hypothetical protein